MEKIYYLSREQYEAVKASWKSEKQHSAWKHIVYNVLRDKDPKHGFHEKKGNIQGNDPWFRYKEALRQIRYYTKDGKCLGIDLPADFLAKLV